LDLRLVSKTRHQRRATTYRLCVFCDRQLPMGPANDREQTPLVYRLARR
jgi:hypothetical protein